MGIFGIFKKKEDLEEEIKVVDPEVEQLRKEKFNMPVIEDEQEQAQVKQPERIRRPNPATENLPNYASKKTPANDTPYSLYKSREIISPMKGRTEKKKVEEEVKPKSAKKKVVYTDSDSLTPVISPMYGQNFKIPAKKEAVVEEVEEEKVEVVKEVTPMAITSIPAPKKTKQEVKQEEEQLIENAIVEQKTGEYKFNFPEEPKKEDSLINEVEDEMTLEELLTLYEKKK